MGKISNAGPSEQGEKTFHAEEKGICKRAIKIIVEFMFLVIS